MKHGTNTAYEGGDITFSDPIGEPLIKLWNIECKTGYAKKKKSKEKNFAGKPGEKRTQVSLINWCVLDFLDSRQTIPTLQPMWMQSVRDGEKTNREPILIFRRPLMQPCIAFRDSYFTRFETTYGVLPRKIHLRFIQDKVAHRIVITSLRDFFEWVPGEGVIALGVADDKRSTHPILPIPQEDRPILLRRRQRI
jgi:hypothetical protein